MKYQQIVQEAQKLENPPWFKKIFCIDYLKVADLYLSASKSTDSSKEIEFCLTKCAYYYEKSELYFDAAETLFSLYELTKNKTFLIQSTIKFQTLKAYSLAATKRAILIEEKDYNMDDLEFIIYNYKMANMKLHTNKYLYYKAYLLFKENMINDCIKILKGIDKNRLIVIIQGDKVEDPSDWFEEEANKLENDLPDIL